ncbi:hypothetical protein AVEN_27205-1 [Araneus ventricosus]|uniref:Mos1 transposase HTH domain-containing protein n=1 Tax=Araneus ventricosus TaxID=182803 RepID=A0A4Y2FH86_ARAVE|nr:hypothetical protein AVEN_27205-1 [Araneus ventricosus]
MGRELDSPNLSGNLPHTHPCYNLPLKRTEMGCDGKGNWTPNRVCLLSDLGTTHTLRRSQTSLTGCRRCSGEISRPPWTASIEQPANIKFYALLEKSPSETLEMMKKAYGNDAMEKTAVYEWHKRFREGRTNIEDDPRTG